MTTVGLKGRATPRRIALHSAHIAEHLTRLARRLQDAGHHKEAETMGVASIACEAVAFSLVAHEEPLH